MMSELLRKIKALLNNSKAIIPKLQRLFFTYFYKPKILESPSINEIEFIEQIRSEAQNLLTSQVILDNPWSQYRTRLFKLILHDDLRNFLNWDVLKETMFYEPEIQELEKLKQHNWQFWQKAIAEDSVGNPKSYYAYTKSSGNLIHHAYHLTQINDSPEALLEYNLIVEFGGGYGSMCRLFYKLGFQGDYIIYDFPELNLLQSYFVKQTTHNYKFYLIDNLFKLKQTIKAYKSSQIKILIIGTWSISEADILTRNQFLNLLQPDTYLIAYQTTFHDIDNFVYFQNYVKKHTNYHWRDYEIHHIPNNRYLIGHKQYSVSQVSEVHHIL